MSTDHVALVDKDGVVTRVCKPTKADIGMWLMDFLDCALKGGTVQRVPSIVKVGDRWPGVCGATLKTDWYYTLDWEMKCGALVETGMADEYPWPHCPGCGNPVEQEDG